MDRRPAASLRYIPSTATGPSRWSELRSCSSAWASLADISSRKPCPGAKGGEGLREMLPVLDLAAAPAKPPAEALPPGRKPHGSRGFLEALAGARRRLESGRLAGTRSDQRPESSQAPEQAVDSAVKTSGDPRWLQPRRRARPECRRPIQPGAGKAVPLRERPLTEPLPSPAPARFLMRQCRRGLRRSWLVLRTDLDGSRNAGRSPQ